MARLAMKPLFSQSILTDIALTIDSALAKAGIINVSRLAREVQRRNERDNVALEDIAAELLRMAQIRGAVMEFDAPSLDPAEQTLQ
jgi:hypothetical protein